MPPGLEGSEIQIGKAKMFVREVFQDLFSAFRDNRFWLSYGVLDARRIYFRTRFGIAWEVIGPALFIYLIGFSYTRLMGYSSADFLPHIALGYIIWLNMQLIVTQGCLTLTRHRAQILSNPRPLLVYPFKNVVTSLIYSSVHLVILIPVVLLYFESFNDANLLIFSYYFILYLFTATGLAALLGVVCLRFRDLEPLITAVNRLAFFVTPILWAEGSMGRAGQMFLSWNPYGYFVSGIRDSILGHETTLSKMLVTLAIATGVMFGAAVSVHLSRNRIPYWL